MRLAEKRCVPCEGGVPPLSRPQAEGFLAEVPGWALAPDGKSLTKAWKHANFREALAFVNRIGEVAEHEDHHPDIHLTGYRRVRADLTTHAIGGLSENDFILAAKINALEGGDPA